MPIDQCKIIKLNEYVSKTGSLTTLENGEIEGFSISRMYFLNNLIENQPRGNHSYLNVSQIIIPIKGTISVEVDDGQNIKTIYSKKSYEGIYIPTNIWRKVTPLTANTLILVLADKHTKTVKKYPTTKNSSLILKV